MAVPAKLFTPIQIGRMLVKNRIAMSPMTTNWATGDGTLSAQMIDYFEARAKGGAGLLFVETMVVDQRFPYYPGSAGLWDDALIPGMKRFADKMHQYGATVVPQISHPGPESHSFLGRIQPVGPSPTFCKTTRQACRELAIEEIQEIVEQYGDAARRAREAGFDAVELHAAHRYMLIGSFLSPLRNRRTDAYGGSADGRLRFALEVAANIKAKAGADFPVFMRISGDEYVFGGRTLRDTLYIAPKLVAAGIDAFEVSGGVMPELETHVLAPMGTPHGLNVGAAAALKQVVNVPVLVVGRINTPQLAEDILRHGHADMVVLGRALLADPDFPNKAAAGRFDDIAPCPACNIGCLSGDGRPSCVINPALGRETEMVLVPAVTPKRVLVAGGGPAGLEAARVAVQRGHTVTLCEKSHRLGGHLNLLALAPGKQEVATWVQYLSGQVRKEGVHVELETEVTPDLVAERKPDVVIVATGAEAVLPPIPGADKPRVLAAADILEAKVNPVPARVLIVGGGRVGCEIADAIAGPNDSFLCPESTVTIVEAKPAIAIDENTAAKMLLMRRLREKGVTVMTSATVKQITDDGAVVDRKGREEIITGMKYVVLACGTRKPVDGLRDALADRVPAVHVIGDAKEPRRALEAIAEGAKVARAI
ncbi:MAG: FAD-dependent oxidoreductase [Candidatus Binatia bacterium]